MFQRFAGEEPQGYTTESIPVGIVDEDGGTAAESLIDYIGLSNDVVLLEMTQSRCRKNCSTGT